MSRIICYIRWSFIILIAPFIANAVWANEGRRVVGRSSAGMNERALSGSNQRIYVSGHSLTGPRVMGLLDKLASAAGIGLAWNLQYLEGSSIRQRRGLAQDAPYQRGVDRWGRPADVLGEFSSRPAGGRPIDIFIVTEQHAVLASIAWEDTIASLRDIDQRFIQANPGGRTIFFEPWLSIDDKSAPQGWIAYERAAAPVWRCIIANINQSLALRGESRHLVSMPIASSLAYMVERAIKLPSSTDYLGYSTLEKVNKFFDDDVHLTELGDFYIASVVFRYIFGHNYKSNWFPPGLSEEVVDFIRDTIDQFMVENGSNFLTDRFNCQDYVENKFIDLFIDYYSKAELRKRSNYVDFIYSRWRLNRGLSSIFRKGGVRSPFLGATN